MATYTVKAGDKYNPYTGKKLSSSQQKAGTVVSDKGKTVSSSSSSNKTSTSSSSSNKTTTPTQTYTVKAGDKYNPFTGETLNSTQQVGTVLTSGSTKTTPTPTPTQTPTTQPTTQPTNQPTTGYTGTSIVDYLSSVSQDSSFSTRLKLAQENGIANYTGTSAQNTELLAKLRQQAMTTAEGGNTPTTAVNTPTGANTGQNQPSTGTITPQVTNPTIQQGSSGDYVKQLQSALSSYGLTVDGVFGPKTLAAVKSFQASKGLVADGIVGPKTWAALSGTTVNPLASIGAGLSIPMTGQIDELTGEPIDTTGLVPNPSGDPQIDTINNLLQQYKNSSPQVQWSEVLKQVYSDMGYNNIKNEYDTYNQEYAKLQEKKNDEVQNINNNPWYTEGERVKRLTQLDNKYEGKELILQNKMKLAETQIDNLRSDAQYITSQTMAQVNANAQLQQDVILKAIDLAESALSAENALMLDQQKLAVDMYEAQTARMKATGTGSVGTTTKSSGLSSTVGQASPAYNGEFGATVDLVANMEGTVAGKNAVKSQLQSLIANGDYASAYNQILNTVGNTLKGTEYTNFSQARTDYVVLGGLRQAVENYTNAGGNMGLLTGTSEQIARKLGIGSGKETELATQLWREFQQYRLNMTGAAFSPAESKDYASVNPTLGKSLNLNLSVIDGALNQLENRITSTVDARVPSAKYIYDYGYGQAGTNATAGTNENWMDALSPEQLSELINMGLIEQ